MLVLYIKKKKKSHNTYHHIVTLWSLVNVFFFFFNFGTLNTAKSGCCIVWNKQNHQEINNTVILSPTVVGACPQWSLSTDVSLQVFWHVAGKTGIITIISVAALNAQCLFQKRKWLQCHFVSNIVQHKSFLACGELIHGNDYQKE